MLEKPSSLRTMSRRHEKTPASRGPSRPNHGRRRGVSTQPRNHGPRGLSAVATVGAEISRRRLLGTVGKVGLAAGLSIGLLESKWLSGLAGANGSCAGGACGPSPLCPSAQCSGGQCYRFGGNANRDYNTNYCGTGGNCWTESWGGGCRNPGNWTCCDCCCCCGCSLGSACGNGPSCTGAFNACICRS